MKKIFSILFIGLFISTVFAQVPSVNIKNEIIKTAEQRLLKKTDKCKKEEKAKNNKIKVMKDEDRAVGQTVQIQ